MTALYLTRARLRRDAPIAALASRLVPANPGDRVQASHQLIWALFADGPDRRRDFLWREETPGNFLALSARPPTELHDLFELDYKDFSPKLAAGDRLHFNLRANAVVSRSAAPGVRGKRHDVVMDMLYPLSKAERAAARLETGLTAGRAWLVRQGVAHGFAPDEDVAVDGCARERVPREVGKHLIFGRMDLTGRLTVQDPAAFLAAIASGFGKARAFGCGLMLIRRA